MSAVNRIFVPARGISEWRRLLADPDRHWARGRSAFELATSWQSASTTARGLPPEVGQLLDPHPQFEGATLLLGIPEHQVEFHGGGHASQNDLWGLLRAPIGLVSFTVEAKAGETFGPTMEEWFAGAVTTSGKPARLQQLKNLLGLTCDIPANVRYQLLHRTASAIVEAERFGANTALMLVQCFRTDRESELAFDGFCALLGCAERRPSLVQALGCGKVDLYLGWVTCEPAQREEVSP